MDPWAAPALHWGQSSPHGTQSPCCIHTGITGEPVSTQPLQGAQPLSGPAQSAPGEVQLPRGWNTLPFLTFLSFPSVLAQKAIQGPKHTKAPLPTQVQSLTKVQGEQS